MQNADPDNRWVDKIRPSYYKLSDNLDVMDVIEAANLNFERGSALKYILRAGKKPKTTETVELRKAIECLEREIKRLEKKGV